MSQGKKSRSPDLIEVLRAAIDKALGDCYVARPGRIISYDPTTQTANCQIMLRNPWVDNEGGTGPADILPPLTMVPVLFPGGGGYFMSFPLMPNDPVLLVFCDRSIDNYWFSDGSQDVDPVDLRTHDISDAVAIPLKIGPLVKVIKGDVMAGAVFGKEAGMQVRVNDTGVEVTAAGLPTSIGGPVAMAMKDDALWLKLYTVFTTWTPIPMDGGAALKAAFTAAFAVPPTTVASSNLKANG